MRKAGLAIVAFQLLDRDAKVSSNRALHVLDALNMMAWTDDAQVVSLSVSKVWSDNPRVEVCVEPCKARVSQKVAA